MDNRYFLHSDRLSESGARLRPSASSESSAGPVLHSASLGNTFGGPGGNAWESLECRKASLRSMESSSRSHRPKLSGADKPTSPAFMKLLSQRSPKTPPSDGSRSPSLVSQLSGRRRVSSPAIAARAWLDSSPLPPPSTPSTNAQVLGDNARGLESRLQEKENHQAFTILPRSRGRPEKKKSREESRDHRRRRSSSSRGHGHRRSHSKSKRETQGRRGQHETVLAPTRQTPEAISPQKSTRPPPKKLMSPRRLPPPTFEKILLGLVDDDFTSGNDEADVFGAETKQQTQETAPSFGTEAEEECVSVSVEHTDSVEDELQNSASFTLLSSSRSSLEGRYESHRKLDGVIPEHYLYIPPLRLCGNSAEENRPVPALMQPTEDEGQVSVREDRRHIATLFSLEAAESHAQKARLQEQLRATSPFRLADVGGSSSASQSDGVEIIGPPPGKSKRRQRSTLLETIVREHDWEAEGRTVEENIHIYQGQQDKPQNLQTSEPSQLHFPTSDEEELSGESTRGKLPGASPNIPRTSAQESFEALYEKPAAAQADDSSELLTGECGSSEDVPGAFDAVWGRSALSSRPANDSKASSQTDRGEDLHELYNTDAATHRLRRMADFLGAASLHCEDDDEESGYIHGTAEEERDLDIASSAGTAAEGPLLPERAAAAGTVVVQLDEYPGTTPLLRLGDPARWEARCTTGIGPSHCTEQSPSNYKGARSGYSETREDNEQQTAGEHGRTVEFEEQEAQGGTYTYAPPEEERETSSGHFPEDPPSTTSREHAGKSLLDQTRMSSYSSTRLASVGNYEQARSAENEAATNRYVTSELQLAAATLDRLRSAQSVASEDAPTEAAASRRSLALAPHCSKSAPRKRQRTVKEEGTTTPTAPSRSGERVTDDSAATPEAKCLLNSSSQAFSRGAESCFFERRQRGKSMCKGLLDANRKERPAAAGSAAAAAAEADFAAERERHRARVKEPFPVDALKSSEETITVDADAWHEGSTVPAHDAENEGTNGHDNSNSFYEEVLPSPLHHCSVSLSPCRSSDPEITRSIDVFEAIGRAISGCAYGPRLHLLILSCMFLAVWALLLVIYLLEGGRGPRFFIGFAVALSFVLSLCAGGVQLTASLFKWKALKCSLDLDLRERIFASLKRLRPAEEGEASTEGKGECGELLELLCSSFVDLLTQGSPGLDISRTMERRFITANTFAAIVAVAFISCLVCIGEVAESSPRLHFQAGDGVVVVAALLYSILLLALSYYLATPPTAAALRRSVELHSVFQYLWSLKLTDFLLERKAVTTRSVQDFRLPSADAYHYCPLSSSLNPRLFKQKDTAAICFRGISNSVRGKYITAMVVLRHPAGVQFDCFKDLRKGQRALLTLTNAPRGLNTSRSSEATSSVYLNLIWCTGRRAAPKQLRILLPPHALSARGDVVAAGRKQGPTSGAALVHFQRPQDVICSLLGMLQEDSTDTFVNSQIRRYLSEAETRLVPACCDYRLVLPLPLRAFNCGRRWHCDHRALKRSNGSASSCNLLKYVYKLGWMGGNSGATGQTTNLSVSVSEENIHRPVLSKEKADGEVTGRVGPWKVHNSPVATHTRSVNMHAYGEQQLNLEGPPTAIDTQHVLYPHARSGTAGAPETPALLTLFFASEEQRQEFKRCIQDTTSA